MRRIHWPLLVAVLIVWLLLWGDVTPLLVAGGLLVAVLTMLVFPAPPRMFTGRVHPWHLVVLIARFGFDLVVASVQVAWIAVRPAPPPLSAVVRVDLTCRSELLMTITSELVSLVPGSLLIDLDADRSRIWLHILDAHRPGTPDRVRAQVLGQERRVLAAFGPDRTPTVSSEEQIR